MTDTDEANRAVITLPSDTTISIVRVFAAPRHLVYRAWTTPEHIKAWWGGHRGTVTLAEVDLRVGGTWRYVMTANAGFEVAFHGVFREVTPDERLVQTEIFEMLPDAEGLVTTSFAEEEGRTRLTMLVEHAAKETRDAQIDSGMEGGLNESLDLLEQVARSLG